MRVVRHPIGEQQELFFLLIKGKEEGEGEAGPLEEFGGLEYCPPPLLKGLHTPTLWQVNKSPLESDNSLYILAFMTSL